jgi:ABC-type Mn2+/Zn2+ transport system ATPase subunit
VEEPGKEDAIVVENGTFAWGDEAPVLTDVNLWVPAGSLVVVVGEVGSSKSSLLMALLGEIRRATPATLVEVRGRVVYAAQGEGPSVREAGEPWREVCDIVPFLWQSRGS